MLFRFPLLLISALLPSTAPSYAQNHKPVSDSLGSGHFRGLHVVNKHVVWVSGSKGSIYHTTNAGNNWKQSSPEVYKTRDFRDIHAWSRRRAIAMSSGDSAVIITTRNGGKSWATVYENNTPGIFLDGMDFQGRNGACLGDPMPVQNDTSARRFLMLITDDAGRRWKEFWPNMPALDGEAAFAASGTSIAYRKEQKHDVITWVSGGGSNPRIFTGIRKNADVLESNDAHTRPLPMKGGEGWGAYTMSLAGDYGVILGGHYRYFRQGDSSAAWRNPANGLFEIADTFPNGYRSGSCFDAKTGYFYCTGTNGTNRSLTKGRTWETFSNVGANAIAVSGRYLWLAGNRGKVHRFRMY